MSRNTKLSMVTTMAILVLLVIVVKGCITVYSAKNHSSIDAFDDKNSGLKVPIAVDASKKSHHYDKDTLLVQQVDTSKGLINKKRKK